MSRESLYVGDHASVLVVIDKRPTMVVVDIFF
jgi:hypothetical protein